MGNDGLILIITILLAAAFLAQILSANYMLHKRVKELEEAAPKEERQPSRLELEIQRRNEGIKNIMEYDINVAYGKGIDNE